MNQNTAGLPVHHRLPEPTSTGFKLVMQRTIRQQHFFLPNSGSLGSNHSLRESCSWIVNSRGMWQKRQPRLGLLTSSLFPSTPGHIPVPTVPVEGAVICRWGDPKEGGWSWEPHPEERWSPGARSELFHPEARSSFACWRLAFRVGGPGRGSARTPGPQGTPWLANILQLP